MVDRYKMARAKGKRHYEELLEQDQALLADFGMGILSASNGVRLVRVKLLREGRVNPWDVIEVNSRLWSWIHPLLVELAALRSSSREAAELNGVNGGASPDRPSLRR